jgi:hypothetical protein
MRPLAQLLILLALPAQAQTSTFRVWGGGLAGRPMLSWSSDGTMRALAALQTSPGVDRESGKAVVHGDDIALCYDILPVKPLPGGLSPPAASYPQVIEYTIPGLSRNKDYTITLREGCTNG